MLGGQAGWEYRFGSVGGAGLGVLKFPREHLLGNRRDSLRKGIEESDITTAGDPKDHLSQETYSMVSLRERCPREAR